MFKSSLIIINQRLTEFTLKMLLFFKRFYLFLQRGEGKEKEGEKLQCVIASRAPPTGDLASNTGMCCDWELNQRPFGLQASAQSTELHQPRQKIVTFIDDGFLIFFLAKCLTLASEPDLK